MSQSKSYRMHTLAVATALVLGSAVATPAFAGKMNTAGLQSQQLHDRFIVKYKDGTDSAASARVMNQGLARAASASGLAPGLDVTRVRHIATGAELVKANRKLDRAQAQSLMRQIAADPNVEYVEVDRLLKPTLTPNDPRYGEQWGYSDADAGIRANTAWDVANGSGIVVAVLDTGITSHSDLNSNMIAGYDFIGDLFVANDGNGRDSNAADPGDWNTDTAQCPAGNSSWHGTHVAGTVAAQTNNGVGVAGTAWGAKVMNVRVLGRCGGYTSDIADGIIWASGGAVSGVPNTTTPAQVINMSLGGGGACDATTQTAINSAVGRGTTVVVAAGNDNADASGFSPASCNNVITVASVTSASARSSFSNYGAKIDVSAPGSSILSTLNSGTTSPSTETYASYNGTSMASPHVAGAVALLQSRRKALGLALYTPAEVESTLKTTAYPLAGACSGGCGAGIINARAAVDAAGGGTPQPGNTLTKGVVVTGLAAATGSSVTYTMSVPSGATNLTFKSSGGTGDADMYVQFGAAPTDTSYVCRPYLSGNTETCTIAAPSAGTYYVKLKAYSSFSGVSLVGDYTPAGGGGTAQTYTNSADYQILDNATVDSPITISGRSGNAPSNASVAVDIRHTYRGDLRVDLVAPDGSIYNISNRAGSSADDLIGTYTINLSTELLNGTWKLRVNDNAGGDTGYINSWSITM